MTSMKEIMKRCLSLGASLSVIFLMRIRRIDLPAQTSLKVAEVPELPPGPVPVPAPLAQAPPNSIFNGTVVRDFSRFALRQADGTLYGFDSAGRAWSFEGEEVTIMGYLHPESRLLHVCSIKAVDDLRAEAV
jgi:hypothetical protein